MKPNKATMTPKEHASQLIDKFIGCQEPKTIIGTENIRLLPPDRKLAKCSAIMAVDEIIEAIRVFHNGPDHVLHESSGWKYWQSVRNELQNL